MISSEKAYGYMASNFILKKSTNGWYSFDCPYCMKSDKRAVNFQYQRVKCWVCEDSVSIMDFVMDIEGVDYRTAMDKVNSYDSIDIAAEDWISLAANKSRSSIELPHGFVSLMEGTGAIARKAQRYLEGRGFDVEKLDSMGFGYCREVCEDFRKNYFGYIIIPFKISGVLRYYIGRQFIGDGFRYKNPSVEDCGVLKSELIYNEDALQYHKKVYLAEGAFDAMTVGDMGISTQGWKVSDVQKGKIIDSFTKEIIIVPDTGFFKQAISFAAELIDHKKVKVVSLEHFEDEDMNSIGAEKVYELEEQSKFLSFSDCMDLRMS